MGTEADEYYATAAVGSLYGVGERYSHALSGQGYKTLFDLLFDLPFRYIDKTRLTPAAAVRADESFYLVKARVLSCRSLKGKALKVSLSDGDGRLEAIFFNARVYFARRFTPGTEVLLFGTAKPDYSGLLCLQHPEATFLKPGEAFTLERNLTPVYHLTESLSQLKLRRIMLSLTAKLKALPLPELIPADLNPYGITLTDALLTLHGPEPPADGSRYLPQLTDEFRRLCLEELAAYHLSLIKLKELNSRRRASPVAVDAAVTADFLASLPFTPTAGQTQAFAEISADLGKTVPMLRLLHGDVGCGKTLVAMLACLQVCRGGMQAVLLAPTELLAEQHYQTFRKFLSRFAVSIALLHGSIPRAQRDEILRAAADGSAQIIIGTHAIYQKDVRYARLALAVIDEQHRFGVGQRASLLRKAPPGTSPHQLVMTATPIPRTLQLALYSSLDVSTLRDKPPGRVSVKTAIVSDRRRTEIMRRLSALCRAGGQAYWVCPLIEEEENTGAAAVSVYDELCRVIPDIPSGLLHGQLPPQQKQAVMADFVKGRLKILVATTIVEVGVDVPDASVMIIDGADRLGLSQLHQLRGRVGRGTARGSCVLIYSTGGGEEGRRASLARLRVLKETDDGFKIASEDLKLRGPGEIAGRRQSGFDFMRVAEVGRDLPLIENARAIARQLMDRDPERAGRLLRRWFPKLAGGSSHGNDA